MPTGNGLSPARSTPPDPPAFEPSAALMILDGLADGGSTAETGSAWDAAWIACLTGAPRWAEIAKREFIRATGGTRTRP